MGLFQRKTAAPVLRLVHSTPVVEEPGQAQAVPSAETVDRHAAHLAALAEARRGRLTDRSPEHWSIAAHSALAALRP
jgi:hypothetical protein